MRADPGFQGHGTGGIGPGKPRDNIAGSQVQDPAAGFRVNSPKARLQPGHGTRLGGRPEKGGDARAVLPDLFRSVFPVEHISPGRGY